MRKILCFCALLLSSALSWAQDAPPAATPSNTGSGITCTQRLRLARATYEAGRLHELVGTILGDDATQCFNLKNQETAFSKQEKVDALKLMILAYIYLEEPLKADEKMLELLNTDHFYVINENSDPAEYVALYRTFRTDPIVSVTLKGGANVNLPTITKIYPVSPEKNAEYKPGVSYQVGLSFEKEFFPKSKIGFLKQTEVMGEVFYFSRAYRMDNSEMFKNITTDVPATSSGYKSNSVWLDLNVLLKYHLNPELNIDPYIALGPSFSYLISAKYDQIQTQHLKENGKTIFNTVVGPAVDVKQTLFSFTNSAIAAGGIKLRLGDVYLNAEARVQFGFLNLVNDKKRFMEEIQTDYGININDYRQTNFTLNVGVTVPIYKPKKKLTHKK